MIDVQRPTEGPTLVDLLDRLAVGSVALTERAVAAAGADLTFVQWRVLLVVGEHQEGVPVGEVAARLGAHASPASRIVSRLKRRGLLGATRDATDHRVARIQLTATGSDLRSRILEHRRRGLAAVLAAANLAVGEAAMVAKLARAFEPLT
ncbi:MAG: MarR family winged helix-turn-helix transcriptional regulator [Candidatus Limnocylindrales bacterium]